MTSLSEVTTPDGRVRGTRERHVLRWRSIPYAAPPVGDLRFRAPAPVQPWRGVIDATRFGFASIQHRTGSQIGPRTIQPQSEDCLTLNITAPAEPSSTPRPVMVFIHGGGYVFGTSAVELYSGASLVRRGGVIVVSMNYRLGALGYVDFSQFSTPDRPIESNLGLRDQVAALQWVQRNIASFGGDPSNVTIFGESAGGAAIATLLATPAAKGLFHRGISESPMADLVTDQQTAADFGAQILDKLGGVPRLLVDADARDIRRAFSAVGKHWFGERPGLVPTVPVVDGDYLPKHPIAAYEDGSAHRVPLIIGTNRDEGTLFDRYIDELPTKPARIATMFEQAGVPIDRIAAAYQGYPAPDAAIRIGGDYMFWRPTFAVAERHSQHAPTYNYRYDFSPRLFDRMRLRATHASELLAVFGFGETIAGRALTAAGGRRGLRRVTQLVQSHWLSFAKYGAPLSSWPQYKADNRKTLILDATPHVETDMDRDRRLAWTEYNDHVESVRAEAAN